MLEFTHAWSWQVKAFIAMLVILPIMVLMPILQKNFGLKPESFFIAWFMGCFVSFVTMAMYTSVPSKEYFSPLWLVGLVFLLAFILGGPGNILLVQSMNMDAIKPPPNPALPFAIVGLASTLAYVLGSLGGKVFPSVFPTVQFSMVNIIGLLLIAAGTAAVMYQKAGG